MSRFSAHTSSYRRAVNMSYFFTGTLLTCWNAVLASAKHATATAHNSNTSQYENRQQKQMCSSMLSPNGHLTAAPKFGTCSTAKRRTQRSQHIYCVRCRPCKTEELTRFYDGYKTVEKKDDSPSHESRWQSGTSLREIEKRRQGRQA